MTEVAVGAVAAAVGDDAAVAVVEVLIALLADGAVEKTVVVILFVEAATFEVQGVAKIVDAAVVAAVVVAAVAKHALAVENHFHNHYFHYQHHWRCWQWLVVLFVADAIARPENG